eukprot:3122325-Rhodomonas_salina.2
MSAVLSCVSRARGGAALVWACYFVRGIVPFAERGEAYIMRNAILHAIGQVQTPPLQNHQTRIHKNHFCTTDRTMQAAYVARWNEGGSCRVYLN